MDLVAHFGIAVVCTGNRKLAELRSFVPSDYTTGRTCRQEIAICSERPPFVGELMLSSATRSRMVIAQSSFYAAVRDQPEQGHD